MCLFVAEAFVVGVAFIYIYKKIGVNNVMKNNDFWKLCVILYNLFIDT
jgi:hypothetical protein